MGIQDKIRANAAAATTEDLLDRVTVYRAGMEPEAIEIIEAELRRRGVTAAAQVEHRARRGTPIEAGGLPRRCERCDRPAVWRGWGWHRLWGVLPVFPRRRSLCQEHRPG